MKLDFGQLRVTFHPSFHIHQTTETTMKHLEFDSNLSTGFQLTIGDLSVAQTTDEPNGLRVRVKGKYRYLYIQKQERWYDYW